MPFTKTPYSGEKPCKDLTDDELIELIKSGKDDQAAKCMHDLFWNKCGHRRKLGVTDQEYVSGFTDALLALIKNIISDKYRKEAKLKTLFCAILRNKLIDEINKRPTKVVELNSNKQEEEDFKNSSISQNIYLNPKENENTNISKASLLQQALDSLYKEDPNCWRLWDGRLARNSWKEIAEEVGYTPQAARQTFAGRCKPLLIRLIAEIALKNLNPPCKDIILRKKKGYTYEEISQELGMSPKEAERKYLTCKDTLRSILGSGNAWEGLNLADEEKFDNDKNDQGDPKVRADEEGSDTKNNDEGNLEGGGNGES